MMIILYFNNRSLIFQRFVRQRIKCLGFTRFNSER